MKVGMRDVRRGLRVMGRICHGLVPSFTERSYRIFNPLLDTCLKGIWLGRKTRMEERFLLREDGTELRLCVCRARRGTQEQVPGILWMHGGGYALGLPEQDFSFIERFAGDGSCVAVLPDYRRSMQAPYPAAIEDCYDALLWMKRHAKELGIREDQLFVAGDSAGGGIAAALCLLARDRGEVAIAFQMPLYPMLDDRMTSASARDNDAPVWNTKSNEIAWELYLGAEHRTKNISAYAAPARAASLADLPPLCTYVGTIEPFYDETVAYVQRMQEAGIPVHFKTFEGCYHGFDIACPESRPAKEARAFSKQTLAYATQHYFRAQPPDVTGSLE